jgi:hypothetical protein
MHAKEFWDHANHYGWSPSAFYDHLHTLASTLCSTKESLEDLLGDVTDHCTRDQKRQSSNSEERTFFYSSISKRIGQSGYAYLSVDAADLTNKEAYANLGHKEAVFGEAIRRSSEVIKLMKSMCIKGLWFYCVITMFLGLGIVPST